MSACGTQQKYTKPPIHFWLASQSRYAYALFLIFSKREVVGFETKLHLPHTLDQTSIYSWEQASVCVRDSVVVR